MTPQETFIKKHKNEVIQATLGTGLFPSVKMAQMILESGWGKGYAVEKANNYFGIKADSSWKGDKVALPTPKDANKVSYFRKYSSVQDSIKDHSDFLKKQGRYAKAGLFNARNYSEQIDSLVKGGYAESKDYANTLNSIIDKYKLKDLDKEARLRSGQKGNTIAIIVTIVIGVVLYKILNKKLKTWKL